MNEAEEAIKFQLEGNQKAILTAQHNLDVTGRLLQDLFNKRAVLTTKMAKIREGRNESINAVIFELERHRERTLTGPEKALIRRSIEMYEELK